MKAINYRVLIILFFLLVVAYSPVIAAENVSGSVYGGVSSMYLWRGFDLSDSEPVFQGGADIGFKGFTLSYWSNYDLDASDLNETDITLDYSFAAGEYLYLSVGNIYYMLDNVDDTNEIYLNVNINTVLSPNFTVYYDYDAADDTGLFYTFSISHDYDISEKMDLSAGALVSYNQESDYSIGAYNGWHNYELSLSADYAVTDEISLSPYAIYSDAMSDEADDNIDSEFVAGLNLSLNF